MTIECYKTTCPLHRGDEPFCDQQGCLMADVNVIRDRLTNNANDFDGIIVDMVAIVAKARQEKAELQTKVEKLKFLVENQLHTIRSLMEGVEEKIGKEGTTPVLRYIAALEEELNETKEKLKVAEDLGMSIGLMKTSGGNYYAYDIKPGSELRRLRDGISDNITLFGALRRVREKANIASPISDDIVHIYEKAMSHLIDKDLYK